MTEIPKSPSDATMDMATDGSSLVAVDHDGGRPPDIIPQGRSNARSMIGLDDNVPMDFDYEVGVSEKGKVAQTASSTMDLINKSKDAEDGDGLYGPWMVVDN
ncbi:hypothetical protein V6N13_098690 [Hibiscus sabdariffa]